MQRGLRWSSRFANCPCLLASIGISPFISMLSDSSISNASVTLHFGVAVNSRPQIHTTADPQFLMNLS